MRWKTHKIVAFDTETTGLDPYESDRIIEFGAVELELGPDGQVAKRTDHNWLINPERKIPRKITEITGIRNEDVENSPLFADVAPMIHDVLSDSVTVAHNYPFDLAFLTEEFNRMDSWWPEPLAEIDTIDLSIRMFPEEKKHKLADLCGRVGVTLERAHRATDDAAACGECLVRLAAKHEVADDLQVMLDWAGAIGRPPETGPLAINGHSTPVFATGKYKDEPIADHPIHLTWMRNARIRENGTWKFRFDEHTRSWLARWLQVRGSGRTRPSLKKFTVEDWGLDDYLAAALRSRQI